MNGQQFPTLIKGSKQTGRNTAAAQDTMTKSGGFFGHSTDQGSTNMDRGNPSIPTTPAASRIPGTSEILFLKRLLYLKASIDNEQTLNTLTVPFEQEKLRDNAMPDQLMLDTNAVLSGKGSINMPLTSGEMN